MPLTHEITRQAAAHGSVKTGRWWSGFVNVAVTTAKACG